MYRFLTIIVCLCAIFCCNAASFTISSYNCGGLSDHYDYIRAAAMQKLTQERYNAEPSTMAFCERIQQLALKSLFSKNREELHRAMVEFQKHQHFFKHITKPPTNDSSPNTFWHNKSEKFLTSYRVRPIIINDQEVQRMLQHHITDLAGEGDFSTQLTKARQIMARRAFKHQLKYDIICLQETAYITQEMFPERYKVEFGGDGELAIAFNTHRFNFIEVIGTVMQRNFVVKLQEKESGKMVLVASGHLTGCSPFQSIVQADTQEEDSIKGDNELRAVLDLFETTDAVIKVIAMDANVAATHPRLRILKDYGYDLDSDNFLEPTCTNPYLVLNTRIDWIAMRSKVSYSSITNIPVLGIGLNSIETNMSDHKPIAARILIPTE